MASLPLNTLLTLPSVFKQCCCCTDDNDDDDDTRFNISINLNCCASHNSTAYHVTDGENKEEEEEQQRRRAAETTLLRSQTFPSGLRQRSYSEPTLGTVSRQGGEMVTIPTHIHLAQTETTSL